MVQVTYGIEERAILNHDVPFFLLFFLLRRILELYIDKRPAAPGQTHIELALVEMILLLGRMIGSSNDQVARSRCNASMPTLGLSSRRGCSHAVIPSIHA